MSKLLKKMSAPTELDKLITYMNGGDVKLGKRELTLLDRYDYCDTQIRKYGLRREMIIRRQMLRFPGISESTAKNDFYATRELHNSIPRATKDYDLEVALEKGWAMIEKYEQENNQRAAASVYKTVMEILAKLKFETEQVVDVPQPSILVVSADPRILGIEPFTPEELKKRLDYWTREKKKQIANRYNDAEDIIFTEPGEDTD